MAISDAVFSQGFLTVARVGDTGSYSFQRTGTYSPERYEANADLPEALRPS